MKRNIKKLLAGVLSFALAGALIAGLVFADTEVTITAVQSDGETISMADAYLEDAAVVEGNDDASVTYVIVADDITDYIDFDYTYYVTSMDWEHTVTFQLLIGEANDDGTYAFDVYYNGEVSERFAAYFGDSVTVEENEDGTYNIGLTCLAVSGAEIVGVAYYVTETVDAEGEEEVVSTTYAIPTDAEGEEDTIDFIFTYSFTAGSYSGTHTYEMTLVLGEETEEGSGEYSFSIYYGETDMTSRLSSYFGETVAVEDGYAYLTVLESAGLDSYSVAYTETVEAASEDLTEETVTGYSVTFAFTETGAQYVTDVQYNSESVSANSDGSYTVEIESLEEQYAISFYVTMMNSYATAYLYVEGSDGTYTVSFQTESGGTSMMSSYVDSTSVEELTESSVSGTVWTIPAEDVETGSYVDFYYSYTITSVGMTNTHAFQLLIGDENSDGTYAYEIYYKGEQNDTWDSYFGNSVAITESGVELTTYPVSMLSDITVYYDAEYDAEYTQEINKTYVIASDDITDYIDFDYTYYVTSTDWEHTVTFQLLIGEANDDGTYAFNVYYNGEVNERFAAYFGDSVTVEENEDGTYNIGLTCLAVSGAEVVGVAYYVTETVDAEGSMNDDETYTITFSFTEEGEELISAVYYEDEELTANEDGSYSIVVASEPAEGDLHEITLDVAVMGGQTVTTYILIGSVTENYDCKSAVVYTMKTDGSGDESMMGTYIEDTIIVVANEDGTYTVTFALNETGAEYDITFGDDVTDNGDGTYSITVDSAVAGTQILVSMTVAVSEMSDMTVSAYLVIGETVAEGHSYDDGTVTTEATETTDGVMTYICEICGDTYTVAIEATGTTKEETTEEETTEEETTEEETTEEETTEEETTEEETTEEETTEEEMTEEETTEEETASDSDEAQTGDANDLILWMCLAAAAILGLGVISIRKKVD